MTNQIIKKVIPINILLSILKHNSRKNEKYYIISKSFYKHLIYHNYLNDFIEQLKNYYYESKQYYLTREMNYKGFLTLIRQICKNNNLTFTSKIKYNNSNYEIEYYIYL